MSFDVRLILTRIENGPDIQEILNEPNSIDLTEQVINNDLQMDCIDTKRVVIIPKMVDALKRLVAHFQLNLKAKLSITEQRVNFIIRIHEIPSDEWLKITYHAESVTEEYDFKDLIEKLKHHCYSNGDFIAMHIKDSVREYQIIELDNPKYLLTSYDLDLDKFDNKDTTLIVLPFIICRDKATRIRLMNDYITKTQTPRVIFITVGYDYKDIKTEELVESVEKYLQFFKIDYKESKDIISVDEEYRYRSKIVYNDEKFIVEDLYQENSVYHRRLFFKDNIKYVQSEMIFGKGEEQLGNKGSEVFGIFLETIQNNLDTDKKTKNTVPHVAILGSGCGTLSKYLTSKFMEMGLRCKITGVEIDEKVMAIGTKYFNMNKDSHCTYKNEDAHNFIMTTKDNYDIVVVDIDGTTNCPPPQFFSQEFINAVRQSLQKSSFGYLAINTIGYSADAFNSYIDALKKSFEVVKVLDCPGITNKVIVCQKPII